jgi:hypothetical protein
MSTASTIPEYSISVPKTAETGESIAALEKALCSSFAHRRISNTDSSFSIVVRTPDSEVSIRALIEGIIGSTPPLIQREHREHEPQKLAIKPLEDDFRPPMK